MAINLSKIEFGIAIFVWIWMVITGSGTASGKSALDQLPFLDFKYWSE